MRRIFAVFVLAFAVLSGMAPAFACESSDCNKPSCSDTNSC